LREKIQDERFINLIRKFLKAGYLEDWQYYQTYSGTPQGSVISPILTNIYLDKLDQKLEAICQQNSQGERRESNPDYYPILLKRTELLKLGQANPQLRKRLKPTIDHLNRQILQTPVYDYNAPSYTRVKFLRYADDVLIGVIGPKALAEQVIDEVATFLQTDLKLELNRPKTRIKHLATERAEFLGYDFQTSGIRYRRRNLRRKGSPHNIVQTIKTTTGNIKLLIPLSKLSQKLKKYMANGQPAAVRAYSNQPIDHIIDHYNALIRGWYNYYQLAENVCRLNYARYILHYSLAKTLAGKERSSVSKIFRKYGKAITYTKPNGRDTHFFNQPLKQVKKAPNTSANPDLQPIWYPRKTQSKLLDKCAICGNAAGVEMHHVRHIRKRGQQLKGFTLYMAAINRKQVPVCRKCHRDIHNGKYDGASLASIEAHIQAHKPVS
ncbi:MAG: hypothetical protein HYR94_10800, partial [Chloroflexi bacterium]|nr:hypothetical protein [Chloroflexota bacterium]